MNAVNTFLSDEFFSPLKRWKKNFPRNQQNALKKKFFSPLLPESGEK